MSLTPFLGEVILFGGSFAPRGFALCDGSLLPIAQNEALFAVLGTTYGGDGENTFGLPDLRDRAPMAPGPGPGLQPRTLGEVSGTDTVTLTAAQLPGHTHAARATGRGDRVDPAGALPAGGGTTARYAPPGPLAAMGAGTGQVGGGRPHLNRQPHLGLTFAIALNGAFPSPDTPEPVDAFTGEVRLYAGIPIPGSWATCSGQLVPILDNSALFALLGITYGGTGQTTFALPDLRGRLPVHRDTTRDDYSLGRRAGVEAVTLTVPQLPGHAHPVPAAATDGTRRSPEGVLMARSTDSEPHYGSGAATEGLAPAAVDSTGGSEPHSNLSPALCLNAIICLNGTFPARG